MTLVFCRRPIKERDKAVNWCKFKIIKLVFCIKVQLSILVLRRDINAFQEHDFYLLILHEESSRRWFSFPEDAAEPKVSIFPSTNFLWQLCACFLWHHQTRPYLDGGNEKALLLCLTSRISHPWPTEAFISYFEGNNDAIRYLFQGTSRKIGSSHYL